MPPSVANASIEGAHVAPFLGFVGNSAVRVSQRRAEQARFITHNALHAHILQRATETALGEEARHEIRLIEPRAEPRRKASPDDDQTSPAQQGAIPGKLPSMAQNRSIACDASASRPSSPSLHSVRASISSTGKPCSARRCA